MVRTRLEMANCFIAIPVAFDMQASIVQPTAAIAVGHVIGVVILKGVLFHIKSLITECWFVNISKADIYKIQTNFYFNLIDRVAIKQAI